MRFNSIISTAALLVPAVFASAPSVNYQGTKGEYVLLISPFNVVAGNYTGYYYSTNYEFNGKDKIGGYMGIQPRDEQPNHLVFSIFANDSYSTHPNCHSGADDWSGVSCALNYPWKYDHNYTTEILRTNFDTETGNSTWTGFLNDLETGEKVVIGEYITGSSIGTLDGYSYIFDEFYSYLSYPKDQCLPYSKYIQYPLVYTDAQGNSHQVKPTSGVLNVSKGDPYSTDPCSAKVNEFNFQITFLPDGTVVYENGQNTPH